MVRAFGKITKNPTFKRSSLNSVDVIAVWSLRLKL